VAERITGGRARHHSFGWARATPWRGRRDIAHLVLGDRVPTDPSVVDACLHALQRAGYRAVVTSAVAPADALPFVDAGFDVRERLHLLQHDLDDLPPRGTEPRSRRAWRNDRDGVLALDDLAFDAFWRLGASGLREALHATPSVRFRVGDGRHGRPSPKETPLAASTNGGGDSGNGLVGPVAYAITGRAGRQGYLQRVAVHPAGRRHGWGRALVLDALRWLRRHDTRRALVNTQWTNDAALALYESCGFRQLPVGLCVLDRSL
jgi:ribosomal protein S18 acetylase RimI-like enzyme